MLAYMLFISTKSNEEKKGGKAKKKKSEREGGRRGRRKGEGKRKISHFKILFYFDHTSEEAPTAFPRLTTSLLLPPKLQHNEHCIHCTWHIKMYGNLHKTFDHHRSWIGSLFLRRRNEESGLHNIKELEIWLKVSRRQEWIISNTMGKFLLPQKSRRRKPHRKLASHTDSFFRFSLSHDNRSIKKDCVWSSAREDTIKVQGQEQK